MENVKTFTIENAEEIENLLKNTKFQPNYLRRNVVENPELRLLANGRKALVLDKPIFSNVKKKGKLFQAVVKHQPWVHQITINKNLKCARHKDRNKGLSLFAMFGDFEGGGLFIETPDGLQPLLSEGFWLEFDGQHPHWTEDFTGDRYSIVAYCKREGA